MPHPPIEERVKALREASRREAPQAGERK